MQIYSNHPLVSVIIATYNREQFIGEAINSILAQTFIDFEILVIDDGSVDNTHTIINSFADPRIRYYYQANKGRSNARNRAIDLALGKYITFLDSDDLYLPNKLALQISYLEANQDISIIYTSAYCINDTGKMLVHKYEATASGWIYKDIAFFIPMTITLPTVMVRREVFEQVGKFDENMSRFEDTDMWRRIAKCYQIHAIPEYTCKLRTHRDNSIVNQDPQRINATLEYYSNKILNEDQEFDLLLRKQGIGRLYRYYANACLSTKVPSFLIEARKLDEIANKFCPSISKRTISKRIKKFITRIWRKLLSFTREWQQHDKNCKSYITSENIKDKFTNIYHNNTFGGHLSRSGEGSNLVQTSVIRNELPKIISKFGIQTMIDAPCGDWYWMRTVNLSNLNLYIGVDIVEDLIVKNTNEFASPKIIFKSLNLLADALPEVDLIFCRDCLVHLSFKDGQEIIANFKRTKAKYLLITTFTNREENKDLVENGVDCFWRPLNMQKHPFNFPSPLLVINEKCSEEAGAYSDKSLGLWLLQDIYVDK